MKLRLLINGGCNSQRFDSPTNGSLVKQIALAHERGDDWNVIHEFGQPLSPNHAAKLIEAVAERVAS